MTSFTRAEFERAYRALLEDARTTEANSGCIECHRCTGCTASTFCRESDRLTRCHYCESCSLCADSAHLSHCQNLIQCNHCHESESCVTSAYLIRCTGLRDCSYCFGCVGLSGKDFHILNEPYDRAEYFAVTRELRHTLKIR